MVAKAGSIPARGAKSKISKMIDFKELKMPEVEAIPVSEKERAWMDFLQVACIAPEPKEKRKKDPESDQPLTIHRTYKLVCKTAFQKNAIAKFCKMRFIDYAITRRGIEVYDVAPNTLNKMRAMVGKSKKTYPLAK